MVSSARRVRRACAVSLALLATPALADWRASFREGVKAADQKRWEQVVRYMKEAIDERPSDDPDRVNIASNRFISYIPNAYLGMALAKLGRCEDALPYFDQAEVQRVAPDREKDEYRPMLQERLRCVNEMMSAVTDAAEKKLAAAQAAANKVVGDAALTAAIDANPELERRRKEALDQLRAANEGAVAAIQASHPPSVRQAITLAESAENAFVALRRDAASSRDTGAAAALGDRRREAEQAIGRARNAREELAKLRSQPAAANAWRGDQALSRGEQGADDLLRQAEELTGKSGAGADDYSRAKSLAEQSTDEYEGLRKSTRDKVARAQQADQQADQAQAEVTRRLEAALASAERSQRELQTARSHPAVREQWARTRELGGREQQLAADLETARRGLRDPAAAAAAVDLASAADRGFQELTREARTRAAPTGTQTTRPPIGPEAGDPDVTPPAAVLPPPALRDAVDAYFRGDFPRVLELLADVGSPAFEDARIQAQAQLFRAAASFAAYRLDGDESKRQAALAAIGRAKAALPELRPSAQYFPPPFLELFAGAGG